MVIVAQLVRASDCGSEGRGFETPHSPRKGFRKLSPFFIFIQEQYNSGLFLKMVPALSFSLPLRFRAIGSVRAKGKLDGFLTIFVRKLIKMNASDFNTFLQENKLTIATAESITAGLLASTIASVSGASSILKGGIITYSEELKIKLLNVNPNTLKNHAAESIETTIEMVKGLSKLGLNSDIYVAVTGVASVSVNQYKIHKSVGQVYIAILFEDQLHSFETIISPNQSKDPRNEIRENTVFFIFDKIKEVMIKKSSI